MKKIRLIILLVISFIIAAKGQNTFTGKRIDSLLNESYMPDEPGVSVLVTKDNNIVIKKAYGLANLEQDIKMDTDHVFKISSMTKPITALAIFILKDQGKLKLSDPVTKYVSELDKKYEVVRIKHLLSHTSGIINYTHTDEYESLYTKYYYQFVNEEISGDSLFNIINAYDLEFNPGDKFVYSNSGYFILEKIIENISGLKYGEFLKENIFTPLNMNNTRCFSFYDIIPGRVNGYTYLDDAIINNPHVFLSGVLTKGPGGLLSTTEDLYSFYKGITRNSNFRNISYDYFLNPFQLNDSSQSYYSLGFFTRNLKRRKMLNHNGDGPGFCSTLLILPDDNIFITILGNNDLYAHGSSRYHENVAKRIAALLINEPFPDFKEIKLTNRELEKFAGDYQSPDGEIRKVIFDENILYTRRGSGRKIQIHPFTENSFYYDGYLIFLTFKKTSGGEVESMTIHYDDGRKIIADKLIIK